MSTANDFVVVVNYPSRKSENEKGMSVDYRQDVLRGFRTKSEAVQFARTQNVRPNDYIYVLKKSENRSCYYRNSKTEGNIP